MGAQCKIRTLTAFFLSLNYRLEPGGKLCHHFVEGKAGTHHSLENYSTSISKREPDSNLGKKKDI